MFWFLKTCIVILFDLNVPFTSILSAICIIFLIIVIFFAYTIIYIYNCILFPGQQGRTMLALIVCLRLKKK